LIQTGNLRKPSRLAFAGAGWDAGLRREGGLDLLRVSFWSGGSWSRVPSHSVPSQYKKWMRGPQNKLINAGGRRRQSTASRLHSPGSLFGRHLCRPPPLSQHYIYYPYYRNRVVFTCVTCIAPYSKPPDSQAPAFTPAWSGRRRVTRQLLASDEGPHGTAHFHCVTV